MPNDCITIFDRPATTGEPMQNDPLAKPPPATRFEARQPYGGSALLFHIEAGSLCMAREVFHPVRGWQRHDLSGVRIARDLPGGRCTAFASALSVAVPGRMQALHLAMVVRGSTGDHLYLSLSNPAAQLPAMAAHSVVQGAVPAWTACPFDAEPAAGRLAITRVQIGDAADRAFVVVDALLDADGRARRARYAIDLGRGASQSAGPRWIEHRLPIDGGRVLASCLGRCRGGWDVDGPYLAGMAGAAPQLLYAPLYNPFNPLQPRWARHLELPRRRAAEAIAACRNADNTSDLYVTAQGTLYYFSATNQTEGAQALALGSGPAFDGLGSLFASATGGRVTVWGLNGAGQVICTSAPQVHVADPAAWSAPDVILSNVEAIAPSPDGDGTDYTFFAHAGGTLVKVTRVPGNAGWTREDVDPFIDG
jgi:hypothetical protein